MWITSVIQSGAHSKRQQYGNDIWNIYCHNQLLSDARRHDKTNNRISRAQKRFIDFIGKSAKGLKATVIRQSLLVHIIFDGPYRLILRIRSNKQNAKESRWIKFLRPKNPEIRCWRRIVLVRCAADTDARETQMVFRSGGIEYNNNSKYFGVHSVWFYCFRLAQNSNPSKHAQYV